MGAHIGILGAGISGLASAYWLAKRGHSVTVLESSNMLGGLGAFFDFNGRKIDRFYHCIMPSDDHFLQLIEDLGLSERLYWKKTLMGMIYNGNHYPFNTCVDLLRFTPFSILQRIRLGGMSLLLRHLGNDDRLDYTPIGTWLTRLFGKSLWERFWSPMFSAKVGDAAARLPSLYLKTRLGRESNVSERGYIDGGLFGLIEALEANIKSLHGFLYTECKVNDIAEKNRQLIVHTATRGTVTFDYIVSTIPLSILSQAASTIDGIDRLPKLDYQGVVNMLLLLDRPLDSYYWTPCISSGTGFDGIVESSALIKPSHYGGYHAAYVMRYTSRDSELFKLSGDDIAKSWTDDFLKLYASRGISSVNVKATFVFKAPFVEPVYPLGYTAIRPGPRIGQSNLFLATTAQVYPYITSWNSSIRVASNTVADVIADINTHGHPSAT